MKEQILKLREEGKSYNEIKKILNCSKGTISYHCGFGQKEKTKKRRNKRRENIIIVKVDNFKHRKHNFIERVRKFNKKKLNKIDKDINSDFTWEDVVEKFGVDTFCYLSGEKINLFEQNYNFDHILPGSRGGKNTLDNLGILHDKVNSMKSDLTPEEFIEMCIKILKYNGYKISKE